MALILQFTFWCFWRLY